MLSSDDAQQRGGRQSELLHHPLRALGLSKNLCDLASAPEKLRDLVIHVLDLLNIFNDLAAAPEKFDLTEPPQTVDELKCKLLSINYELESAKMRANEEVSKNEEIAKQLFHLLKVACRERDEARDQLQKLLKMFLPIPAEDETSYIFSGVNNENFPILQNTSNFSTVKGSDVLSKPGPSPSRYNFAAESSNLGFPKNAAVQGFDESMQAATLCSSNLKIIDRADVLIDDIVRVRPLPKKGRLFQAVMENEPLLQTLLVAPLPKWKNPPPLPPLKSSSCSPIYGCDFGSQEQNEAVNPNRAGSSSLGFSNIPSSSLSNFGHGSASIKTGVGTSSSDLMQHQSGTCKRRKTRF